MIFVKEFRNYFDFSNNIYIFVGLYNTIFAYDIKLRN
jgi:hypothetical protein